jgi:pimeloyl-ACP methyl ester carboxylesterase
MTSQAFVDLGEYRLCLMTAGQGTPLVILEAGAGDASTTWQGIFQAVAHFTQVLAYDRAGLGQSDAAPRPRTAWQLTDDLEKLLRLAQLAGPYVLVGHSLGALLSRLYAQRYPQGVAGLILIDGPHPEQGSRFARALMATGYHQHELVQPILEMAAGVPPEAHPEGLDFASSLAQIDSAHRFGALPLVVVASGKSHALEMPALPQEAALAFDQAWDDMQRDLATLSTRGRHLTAKRSGHYIHWDEPDLVVGAIHQIVRDIQNR